MNAKVNRRAFLALCAASKRRSGQLDHKHARLPIIEPEWVKANMPLHGRAEYLHSLGGGDEELTYTQWRIPLDHGTTVKTMVMSRVRLWEVLHDRNDGSES